jgi:lipopolysaccharide transport system ATP-binding protein
MSSDLAIRFEDVGKEYRVGAASSGGRFKYQSLSERLAGTLRHPLRAAAGALRRPDTDSFWALKGVSFDVNRGEVVGVIGRNGAGKSTLLKILSQITRPSEGQIEVHGRVGSLLEVGTGFHPELTGRENVFLNGAILGMTQREVRAKFDEIVAFSEVERFLDTPVKQYSSGMYTRLAFAVAAHLDPEILVVDEVLAVGDAEFQKKCLGKMQDVASGGRTVLFVSHNMAAVQSLCSSGVLLDKGRIRDAGPITKVLDTYQAGGAAANDNFPKEYRGNNGVMLRIMSVDYASDSVNLRLNVHLPFQVNSFGVGLHVHNMHGYRLARLWPAYCLPVFGNQTGAVELTVTLSQLTKHLAAGIYNVGISLHETHVSTLLDVDSAVVIDVPEVDIMGTGFPFRLTESGPVPLVCDAQLSSAS